MSRSTAVLALFLVILLLAAFFTSCSQDTEVWRARDMKGNTVMVELYPVGYFPGDTVLVHRHDFIGIQPLFNTRVVLGASVPDPL